MDKGQESRWESRVWTARLLRLVIFLVPVLAAVGVAYLVSKILPRSESAGGILLWWASVIGAAIGTLLMVDRLARKALPVALLMQMTMLFPDRAPDRLKMVRISGTVRRLEERLETARTLGDDDMTQAAENILALAAALNAHDRMTRGHSERVRVFTDLIAEEMGLDETARDKLRWASLLHDIGKLDVHTDILNKPERPTAEEWEQLRNHPMYGAELLGPLKPWLSEWAPAVEQHHEKYDGTGYPLGLAGNQISLAARVVAVADSYDAITAARSYKKPISAELAREELAASAGTHFDPNVVRAFLAVSLGKIRWVIGPASWFAQIPFIGGLERFGRDLAVLGAAALVILGLISGGAITRPSPADTGGTAVSGAGVPDGSTSSSIINGTTTTDPAATTTTASDSTTTSLDPNAPSTTEPGGSTDATNATSTTQPGASTPTTAPGSPPTTSTSTTTTTSTTSTTTTTTTTTPQVLHPPVAVDDSASTPEDVTITIAVTANDSDPDGDEVTVASADAESSSGGIVSCSTSSCTFTPGENFVGTDVFAYVATDGHGGTDQATVTVTVTAVNDPPVARNDTASTSVNVAVVIFVLANDSDPEGQQRTIVAFDSTTAAGGTVSCTSSCLYIPPTGFSGTDSFGYTISDGDGGTSSATVTVTVQ